MSSAGVYLFECRAAADLSRRTKVFSEMLASPALTDLMIREFETLAPANAITAGLVSGATAA